MTGRAPSSPIWPCSRRGLHGRTVTGTPVRSYRTISPLPAEAGGMFLLHFPSACAARALPGAMPGGVRTFLYARMRSDCLARWTDVIVDWRLAVVDLWRTERREPRTELVNRRGAWVGILSSTHECAATAWVGILAGPMSLSIGDWRLSISAEPSAENREPRTELVNRRGAWVGILTSTHECAATAWVGILVGLESLSIGDCRFYRPCQ